MESAWGALFVSVFENAIVWCARARPRSIPKLYLDGKILLSRIRRIRRRTRSVVRNAPSDRQTCRRRNFGFFFFQKFFFCLYSFDRPKCRRISGYSHPRGDTRRTCDTSSIHATHTCRSTASSARKSRRIIVVLVFAESSVNEP